MSALRRFALVTSLPVLPGCAGGGDGTGATRERLGAETPLYDLDDDGLGGIKDFRRIPRR